MTKSNRMVPTLIGYPGSHLNNKLEDSTIAICLSWAEKSLLVDFLRRFRGERVKPDCIPSNALRMTMTPVINDANVEQYISLICAARDLCYTDRFLFCLTKAKHQELENMFNKWNTGGRLQVRLWDPTTGRSFEAKLFKPEWEKLKMVGRSAWTRWRITSKIASGRKIVVLRQEDVVEESGTRSTTHY